jgi:hypothetical protein
LLSLAALTPVLPKLQELKIIDCKIPSWVSEKLVNELQVSCKL